MIRTAKTLLALTSAAGLCLASPAASAARPGTQPQPQNVRMNNVQVVATHNSYHQELPPAEQAVQLQHDPGAYPNLFYSHEPLATQFARQDVRSIELDVHADPEGGLYAHPLVRKTAGLGPLEDPAWREPGTKVFHMVDVDYGTSCVTLTECLTQVKRWSDENKGHTPIVIMLEFKSSEARFEKLGGVKSPGWDEARFQELEAEIREVFDDQRLITPDDIRKPGLTLEESVLKHGWPSLQASAGKVMFAMDNTNAVRTAYLDGHPSLEGRVLFTDSSPGQPSSAFMKRNNPKGKVGEIQDLVSRGYYVRTRSDEPMKTVLNNDLQMRADALASGAQLVSTDFPEPGMTARWGSDYVVQLPNGGTVRCNPVNAPRSCKDSRLER